MEEWQYKQINALKQIAQPYWKYIDIGASTGELLQYFIKSMDYGYAFEPDPMNYANLINRFGNNNVTIINKAVSDICGNINFWDNGSHMGNILGHDMSFTPYANSFLVESTTLDDFLVDKSVDFIKIDVEGAEWKIFKGATQTLKNKNIVYQVEFHLDEDWHQREILYDHNYGIYDLNLNKLSHNDPRPYQAILIKNTDDRFKYLLER
jgi:FkbM family methyltransferase